MIAASGYCVIADLQVGIATTLVVRDLIVQFHRFLLLLLNCISCGAHGVTVCQLNHDWEVNIAPGPEN